MIWKILVICLFIAIAIGVGLYARRSTTSVDGFVLGGRNVGPWLSAFAYGTSYFSAVIFVGYAGQFGWRFGLSATWAGIGNAILGSLLAWWVLGPRAREMTHRLGATTMPEFFGKRFNSRALRIAAAAIIFVFLIPYTASVYNGLSRLIVIAFGIDIPYEYCIVLMAVVTAVYVVLGGYMATVMNDFIQGVVMLVGIVLVIVFVLNGHGGFSQAIITLSQVQADGIEMQGAFTSFFGPDLANLIGVVVLTSLGTWGLPQMVQKFYAIKSGPAVKQGAIISTVFAFVIAGGSYFLGGFGRLAALEPMTAKYIEYNAATGAIVYDSIMPALVSNIPDILLGILVVMVLSASMSTLSSLVLTSSSTLTLDLIKGNIVKDMNEKKQVNWMRVLLVVFIAVSAAIGIIQVKGSLPFIAQLMGISWGALAGAFLGPFLWGLYSGKVSKAAVWTSFILGVGLTVGNMACNNAIALAIFGSGAANPINVGALAMVISLIVVPLVSLFTPSVPFAINPPSAKGAGDLAFEASVVGQEISAATEGKGIEGDAADKIAGVGK
ncbi:MAG: sodium:solute symporter family protein [Eggerthellaceae bacterium]|nr:sodium:solute symporter family protein [Eggerthellaceae bacterium]